jgi:diaminopimelate decarboxylase
VTAPDLELLPQGARLGEDGRLLIGGCAVADVADRHGTPLLLLAEDALRARAAAYLSAFGSRHADTEVYFASKAFPSASVIRVLAEEGLGFDVASGNELAIARAAGVRPDRLLLHGNAKSDEELSAALAGRVRYVVIDNLDDVERIARLSSRVQPVLVRVVPEVVAHTHEAVATGHAGSKFGVPLDQVDEVVRRIRAEPSTMRLDGLHAHIGSQIFDLDQFADAVAVLGRLERFPVYDLGGGLAARYVAEDPEASIDGYAETVVGAVHRHLGTDVKILVEPGRSLIGPTAVSVYTVVTVKRGERTHVAVDGGMGDNLEVSLYGQPFQPWLLDGGREPERCDIVGHHCESGDVLVRDAMVARPAVGDRLVVPVTGAYTFSMSNNYNGACRPPVVLCRDGTARLAVRRETLADLLTREMLLPGDADGWDR